MPDAGSGIVRSGPGLEARDFTCVASNGFGDGQNSYAHAMAWFADHLFVGTTRATLPMVHFNDPSIMKVWPTVCPHDIDTLDRRARIWRFNPRTCAWREVYVSPMVSGHQGKRVARDIGYRGMAVHPSGRNPHLYVAAWASSRSERAPVLLKSTDGSRFAVLPDPKFAHQSNTFRTLVPHGDRLFTSPTGSTRGWKGGRFQGSTSNVAEQPRVLESRDPSAGRWHAVSEPGFGDPANTTVFEMVPFGRFLYAGTLNPKDGLQIWKASVDGSRPYHWHQVVRRGAGRQALNECATSMCVFGNALYVGTGIQNGGYDRKHDVGPAASELIRVHPDDTWDLIVGRPRLTEQGLKRPLSGWGPGFDDPFNAYFWRMSEHDGVLYLGTYRWGVLLPYLPIERWPRPAADAVHQHGVERLASEAGGFELWRSRDGVQWEPVTRDGFGNPYNYGVRTMVSTPHGLFLGTANPFGPEVARRDGRGWHYEPNPRGGLEVWMGRAREITQIPERPALRLTPLTRERPSAGAVVRRTNEVYDEWMYTPVSEHLYEGSDFFNFGYWDRTTATPRQASERLMERLLAFVPEHRGTILDVACGKGATTRHLLRHYPPSRVTGINISPKQIERCRENAPGIRFLVMNATALDFPPSSFDTVICVEAALHFKTREQFLREALRVLKPGGHLVMSDILMRPGAESELPLLHTENYVPSAAAYATLCRRVGFTRPHVENVTTHTWQPYLEYLTGVLRLGVAAGWLPWWTFLRETRRNAWMEHAITAYVLVHARKAPRR